MMHIHWIGLTMVPLCVARMLLLSEQPGSRGGCGSPTRQVDQVLVVPGMMGALLTLGGGQERIHHCAVDPLAPASPPTL